MSVASYTDATGADQSLFRKQAVVALRLRWFGPVLIVTPPSLAVAVAIAIMAIASLVAATVVIEIPERIRADGILLPAEGLLRVRASRSGWVDKLDVASGAAVERGQPLMWLIDEERAPLREPESQSRIVSLQHELQLLEQSLQQDVAAATDRGLLGEQRVRLIRDRIKAAAEEYELRLRQAQLQQTRSQRLASLADAAAVSAHAADDQAAAVLNAQAAAAEALQRTMALRDELARLELQALDDSTAPQRLATQTHIRRETLLREIATSALQSVLEVTAPNDGVVASLVVRAGSYVQAGQVLLTLHNPEEPLEAYLYVSADNAGMIQPGQPVELQLRAYPHQLFGTQSATITSVSAVAIAGREIDAAITISGPVFEVRAELASTSIHARGGMWSLPPGTVFAADLIRRRWPLYRWLLRSATDDDTHAA